MVFGCRHLTIIFFCTRKTVTIPMDVADGQEFECGRLRYEDGVSLSIGVRWRGRSVDLSDYPAFGT